LDPSNSLTFSLIANYADLAIEEKFYVNLRIEVSFTSTSSFFYLK